MHLHHLVSFVFAEPGEAVTLQCTIGKKSSELFLWYKQRLGHTPQQVGLSGPRLDPILFPPFQESGFKLERTDKTISLTIPCATKDDEGMYFCGSSLVNVITFFSGSFLAVTGDPDMNFYNLSLLQTPASASVPPGESVTLQCTVLSEIHSEDLRVLWFRSAAGRSFPEIIYTDHNSSSSRQCETSSSPHSCVYNFSKNILNDSDAGTYYCAVSTCGKILFGNGTAVDLMRPVNSSIIYLAVALGMCVVVISAQAVVICKRKSCGHCGERHRQGNVAQMRANQAQNAAELNYAALHFSKRETTSGRREPPQLSLYSEVKCATNAD
ncbi:uncharacterized protein [Salminus brasiliensis]|uniref:uncharacterized protein n=1 Tax=Salminus brasiliensis TaxID=930266 RepID=UPI003B82FDC3